MNSLFKKINVLLKASIRDALGDTLDTGSKSRRLLKPNELGRDVDQNIASFRERVDEALAYEQEILAQIDQLQRELAEVDARADAAVEAGHDDEARRLIQRVQRLQKQLAFTHADLDEHRLVTQELISQVSQLEAVVAETRKRAENQPEDPEPEEAKTDPIEKSRQILSDALKGARDKIDEVVSGQTDQHSETGIPVTSLEDKTSNDGDDDDDIDDDLARRRARLSKPE